MLLVPIFYMWTLRLSLSKSSSWSLRHYLPSILTQIECTFKAHDADDVLIAIGVCTNVVSV